jgi:REP element-mobilizing transposase RayT
VRFAFVHAAVVYGKTYERNLPHFHPDSIPIFLTWRLYGSIPREKLDDIRAARAKSAREEFRAVEALLDQSVSGPRDLNDPRIAEEVSKCIEVGATELGRYFLHEFVIMPNHVHALITPRVQLPVLLRSLKGFTAYRANRILGRAGQPFWQQETFDRWARDYEQFVRMRRYIADNPVKAHLALRAEDWPWSSAHRRIGITEFPVAARDPAWRVVP